MKIILLSHPGLCTDAKMEEYVDRMITETTWYAEAIKNHKANCGLPSA